MITDTTFSNKPTRHISEVCYMVNMGCGVDCWRICGKVDGRSLMPGFPVFVDKENGVIETERSIYKIVDYHTDKEEFWNQVFDDMKNGGFKSW